MDLMLKAIMPNLIQLCRLFSDLHQLSLTEEIQVSAYCCNNTTTNFSITFT
jgi:hypothetical protein